MNTRETGWGSLSLSPAGIRVKVNQNLRDMRMGHGRLCRPPGAPSGGSAPCRPRNGRDFRHNGKEMQG